MEILAPGSFAKDITRSSNRHNLKEMTSGAHDRAETRWFSRGKFTSRDSYLHWLEAMRSVHMSLGATAVREAALTQYSSIEAKRINALSLDLGMPKSSLKIKVPAEVSAAWSWGALYALNGSSLGASILLKSQSVQSDWPNRYLQEMRYFATSGALGEFFAELDHLKLNRKEAARGANAVFSALAATE